MGVVGRIQELWEAGQVSHHGAYSLERLCAFSEYAQQNSGLRVLVVCILTIIPPIALVLLVDCIPLQDPHLGWKANWTLWIQVFIRGFCLSFGVALELLVMAPAAGLTVATCAFISLGAATVYVILTLPIAIFIAFPIPFMFISTAGVWDVSFLLSIAAVVGPSQLKQSDEIKAQVQRFGNIVVAQLPMVMVYPALNALYVRLDSNSRMALVLVLPVVKFVLKNLLARTATDLEDYVPTLILSIDFFNTIYQSKCLQGSGSHLATAGVLLIDMVQNVVSLRRLHLHVIGVQALQSKINSVSPATEADLLASVLKTCEHPELLHDSYLAAIQLRSCATIQFPHRRNSLIATIRTHQQKVRSNSVVATPRLNEKSRAVKIAVVSKKKISRVRVAPLVLNKVRSKTNIWQEPEMPTAISAWSVETVKSEKEQLSEQKTLLLKKTLRLLRRTEMLLLVEYVECDPCALCNLCIDPVLPAKC